MTNLIYNLCAKKNYTHIIDNMAFLYSYNKYNIIHIELEGQIRNTDNMNSFIQKSFNIIWLRVKYNSLHGQLMRELFMINYAKQMIKQYTFEHSNNQISMDDKKSFI